MLEFVYKDRFQYPTYIMLNVTDDCNLQCKYCFVEQHPHYMGFDIAKQTADWIVKNKQIRIKNNYPIFNNKSTIYFFGGEPMLCYESIIKPLVQYCKETYPNEFAFGMTTNGTLLNKERIDFLKENNFDLLLSIDGDKYTQDFNRPCRDCNLSSFDLLEKNIPYLLENFPYIRFRSTIYAPTVDHLFENYLYAESLGFTKWVGVEDVRHEWTDEQIETLKNEIAKIYSYRIGQILKEERPMNNGRFNDWLRFTLHLYDDSNYYETKNWITAERCGMGTTVAAVGWDGTIYGCQEQVSKDNKNIFKIGHINTGIDLKLHYDLLKFYFDNQVAKKDKNIECQDCPLRPLCQLNVQGCPSTTFDLFKDMNSKTNITCQMRKIYYYNSLLFLRILFSIENKNIHNYLLKILKGREDSNGG